MHPYAHPVYPTPSDVWRYGAPAASFGPGLPGSPAGDSSRPPRYPFCFPPGPPPGYPFAQPFAPGWGMAGFPGFAPGDASRARPVAPQPAPAGGAGAAPLSPAADRPVGTALLQGPGDGPAHAAEPDERSERRDYGPEPFVTDIEEATKRNQTFRTALWTGNHLQLTLMSIPAGESIGLERHEHTDQFIRIEEGKGLVEMGAAADRLDFRRAVEEDDVILVPAGSWHNLTNTGPRPLKLYSIYAPPEHPRGTVHATKQAAMAAEG